MRIVIALAAILTVALAGCGGGPNAGQSGRNAAKPATQGGLPTPGARPQGGQGFDNGFRQGFRATGIATCVSSAEARAAQGGGAAPGTDFRPACTCYIDRAMAGLSAEQLQRLTPGPREQAILEQCARENGLQAEGGGK